MDFNEQTATQAVQDSFRKTADPRLQEILNALTRHLHAFVRETRPSIQEWEEAMAGSAQRPQIRRAGTRRRPHASV